jgi:hypothetical protein
LVETSIELVDVRACPGKVLLDRVSKPLTLGSDIRHSVIGVLDDKEEFTPYHSCPRWVHAARARRELEDLGLAFEGYMHSRTVAIDQSRSGRIADRASEVIARYVYLDARRSIHVHVLTP